MPHPIREKLQGFTDYHDDLYLIEIDEQEEAISVYNHEIMGFTPNLQLLPEIGHLIHYGGNSYQLIPELIKRGFLVTAIDDRHADMIFRRLLNKIIIKDQ